MYHIAHAAACKISRVPNIQAAMLNGAIHSETTSYESRDSFHFLRDAAKKKNRTMSLHFARGPNRRERNVADPSSLIRSDIRSRK